MWWVPVGSWFRDHKGAFWEGPEQVEDKSVAGVAKAYDYLLRLPYQSADDRGRIEDLKFIQMIKARKKT